MHAQSLSHVQLFETPCTIAHQALLSMESSRQEYWRGLPFPTLGDLRDPGIKPVSPASPALAGGFFTIEPTGKPQRLLQIFPSCCNGATSIPYSQESCENFWIKIKSMDQGWDHVSFPPKKEKRKLNTVLSVDKMQYVWMECESRSEWNFGQ